MRAAIDRKASCTDDIHPLECSGLAGQPSSRHKDISRQNERRANPSGGFYQDMVDQAANFRNTYCRMPPLLKYSTSLAVSMRQSVSKVNVLPSLRVT